MRFLAAYVTAYQPMAGRSYLHSPYRQCPADVYFGPQAGRGRASSRMRDTSNVCPKAEALHSHYHGNTSSMTHKNGQSYGLWHHTWLRHTAISQQNRHVQGHSLSALRRIASRTRYTMMMVSCLRQSMQTSFHWKSLLLSQMRTWRRSSYLRLRSRLLEYLTHLE